MTAALLGIRNWPAAIIWLFVLGAILAGVLVAREDQRHRRAELERGRRNYPCSHGAADGPRWGHGRRP